ncbi:hypothetical protein [Rhodobacter maris]|uniref:Uncharacterized protein n=1 Tax=Rhodobacter maris TaxID=446682 RepID=A0A285TIJ1_9RHOB|nr:hypothetical protein [Rhodobacter maris]SOC22004.1 hypothetical protein SAMN05877831_12614 [Rhodobacter maris]
MRILDASLAARLAAAPEEGIAPVHLVWIVARDRDTGAAAPMGFWSGDEDVTLVLTAPDGTTASRLYLGGCGLAVEGVEYVADLTDTPVTVSLSQIAEAAQELVRGLDVRLAYVEIHATTMTGGALTSAPQLQWVGIVDEGPVSTPAAGGEGGIALSIRSEIMTQLGAVNPAKSSDTHQKRRLSTDRFCEYAGVIKEKKDPWYKG